jgi:outer membrane protein TolC
MPPLRPALHPFALACAVLLSGCASVAPDSGFGAVSEMTRERIGQEARIVRTGADARALAEHIKAQLKQPLSADGAVGIALLNHPGLQATYWDVGIAQADLVQATRLPNPGFGFSRTHGGGEVEIERSLTVDLVATLTMPLSRRLEQRRFEQARLTVAAAIEQHAAQTRRAWVEAVAARQAVDYARRVNAAAEASAELTQRMAQAGNASKLDLAREQAFYAESSAALMRAGRDATAARERLTRLLGLWGQDASFALPERLPDLPAAPAELHDIERQAMERRLDIQAARLDAKATAATLGLTRTTRFVNVFELGYERNSETGKPSRRGYELSLELPLFDWGGARIARAEAIYMQSLNKVAEAAINARSEARQSYLAYRTNYDLARHYRDEVIPLRKKISDETLLRYNAMLASTFELLADAREQAGAVNAYIEALKDFWITQAELDAALGGRIATSKMKEHAQ